MFTRYYSRAFDFPRPGEGEEDFRLTENKYSINEYFFRPFGKDKNLITTRHGGWLLLSDDDFTALKTNRLKGRMALFLNLEKAGIILTERSIRAVSHDLQKEYEFIFFPPNYHVIAITNKCNFGCVYCHPDAGPRKGEMTEETAVKVLDFIFSIPMTGGCQIVLEGGEPLLKWDLIKFLYSQAHKRADEHGLELRFSFTTNLSLMTDEIAGDLAAMHINPCISLDGPKDIHDKQRPLLGGGGTYDKVIYWAKRLKEKYALDVYGIPVVTRLSLEQGPRPLVDEYLKIGQNTVFFKPFRVSGRAQTNFNSLAISPEEFFNFWKEGIEYLLLLNKQGKKVKELNTIYLITNILTPYRKSMCHHRPCGAGFSILSYDCNGVINGCDATRGQGFLDFGNVFENTYADVKKSILPLLAVGSDLIPICTSCPFIAYCGNCLSDNFGRENDIYPKVPRAFGCRWQKMAMEYLFEKFIENGEDAKILEGWKAV